MLLSGSTIDVGGLISVDTTWDADLVRVLESVEIAPDAALTIAPGTRVQFDGFFRLLVRGRLWAVGQPDARIHFTTAEQQTDEGWDGIDFINIPAANDSSRLEHCYLTNAVARPARDGTTRSQNGGAVSIVDVNKLAIASCIFENNRADYGGAIYCGYGSSPVIAGNLFHNNSAVWNGSVLFNVYAYPSLINNTLTGNICMAESIFHLCGAVENFNGKIPLINNIIRNNFTNHHDQSQLVSNKDYYTTANNIEGYLGNDSNLDIDPGFIGAGKNPYQLMSNSPCIDFGHDHVLAAALAPFDITGNNRICGPALDLGAFEYCGEISQAALPGPRLMLSCAPNPFNPRTRIIFTLPHSSETVLTVYDLQGRQIITLLNTMVSAGQHEVFWNGCDENSRALASGIYFYRLQTENAHISHTMTLVR